MLAGSRKLVVTGPGAHPVMRMEAVLFLVFIVFLFILGGSAVSAWQRHKKDKLRILEEAMRNDQVDPETKRRIIESIQSPNTAVTGARLLFGLGWIAFFLGIGLMLAGQRDLFEGGAILSAIGFGLVTLPMAFREIDARKRA